jgi:His/Glu/Gln/Arg/opine family amino acid ABC transporter permease subunit
VLDFHGYGWVFWAGTKVTLLVGLSAVPLALLLGLLGAWGKLGGNPIARSLAGAYTTIVRGVPELVLILLVYYGVTILLQRLLSLATGGDVIIDIDPFTAGTLTLGVIYGAFTTEVFRGAFQALDRGQIEAAYAAGMTRTLAFRRIMLPQVWRFALPGLGNVWLVLIKANDRHRRARGAPAVHLLLRRLGHLPSDHHRVSAGAAPGGGMGQSRHPAGVTRWTSR